MRSTEARPHPEVGDEDCPAGNASFLSCREKIHPKPESGVWRLEDRKASLSGAKTIWTQTLSSREAWHAPSAEPPGHRKPRGAQAVLWSLGGFFCGKNNKGLTDKGWYSGISTSSDLKSIRENEFWLHLWVMKNNQKWLVNPWKL